MSYVNVVRKIKNDTGDIEEALNTASLFENARSDFKLIIYAWADGQDVEFEYQGITLAEIQKKEACSISKALLLMHLLMISPSLITDYLDWLSVHED